MRLMVVIASVALVATAARTGQQLWQQWQLPVTPAVLTIPQAAPGALDHAGQRKARNWPALFGPEDDPPSMAPEPVFSDPPKPPPPDLASLGYRLKGLVRADNAEWALISHPDGDRVLRLGDTLEAGLIVQEISAAGVRIGPSGELGEMLAFPK